MMYKTSALRCNMCDKFKDKICKITGRVHSPSDNCDVNSDEKEMRSGKIKDNLVYFPR